MTRKGLIKAEDNYFRRHVEIRYAQKMTNCAKYIQDFLGDSL